MHHPRCYDCHRSFDLRGKSALVTGAAHGLGLAMATGLVGAGAKVAFLDSEREPLEDVVADARTHGQAMALAADVRDEPAVSAAVQRAAEIFGGIDILVNNAAIYPISRFEESSTAELTNVLDVNVIGYARLIRAALPFLEEGGRVINIASITVWLGMETLSSYVASKAAVVGLTRVLAKELGPRDITVNAICPGAFPTRTEAAAADKEALNAQVIGEQAIKRRGHVSDIAAAALFLASGAASFVTGQTLTVDGGWVLH